MKGKRHTPQQIIAKQGNLFSTRLLLPQRVYNRVAMAPGSLCPRRSRLTRRVANAVKIFSPDGNLERSIPVPAPISVVLLPGGGMAVLTYQMVSRDGDVTRRGNATQVYQRKKEGWRIIHTHWSTSRPPMPAPPQPCPPILHKGDRIMLPNAFIGKAQKPTDAELAAALGPAKALWDQLVAELAQECNLDIQEWNSYSRKAGWSLRLKRKDRNIVYLSPSRGLFMASFALGDKAVKAARQSGLPQRVIKILDEARRYAEGTAVRLDVKGPRDITVVKKLAAVKLQN